MSTYEESTRQLRGLRARINELYEGLLRLDAELDELDTDDDADVIEVRTKTCGDNPPVAVPDRTMVHTRTTITNRRLYIQHGAVVIELTLSTGDEDVTRLDPATAAWVGGELVRLAEEAGA